MNNYYDEYGRLHHKPCIDGKPSSNNGWIYTAYEDKLDPLTPFRKIELEECFNLCLLPDKVILRSPNKLSPPMSRDEILGLAALGILKPRHLDGWSFSPYPVPKLNPIKLIKQLWQLRPSIKQNRTWEDGEDIVTGHYLEFKHRNYFWENNLDQIYHFAFSVPLVDRAFILRCWGETTSLRYLFYRTIEGLDRLSTKESGIRWLKYGTGLKAMKDYMLKLGKPVYEIILKAHNV